MVGDVQVGKTTLMVKYVENRLDQDYIQVRQDKHHYSPPFRSRHRTLFPTSPVIMAMG